jgi:hypothetical protein
VKKANATDSTRIPVIGLAIDTAASGSHPVALLGVYRNDAKFNWATFGAVNGLIYISTSGTLSQTQPSGGGELVQCVGLALNAKRMLVRPQLDYFTRKFDTGGSPPSTPTGFVPTFEA